MSGKAKAFDDSIRILQKARQELIGGSAEDDKTEIYLTPEQISERLQVVIETVYRWLRSGKLRGSHLSRKAWRISEADLRTFMEGGKNGVTD